MSEFDAPHANSTGLDSALCQYVFEFALLPMNPTCTDAVLYVATHPAGQMDAAVGFIHL
jgi:hypothetical protein